MSSHSDGSLLTWTVRQLKPTNVTHPHGESQYPLFDSLWSYNCVIGYVRQHFIPYIYNIYSPLYSLDYIHVLFFFLSLCIIPLYIVFITSLHTSSLAKSFFFSSLAKATKDGEPEPCKSIQKVEWKLSRSGFVIYPNSFSIPDSYYYRHTNIEKISSFGYV